jgi:hypothetical protein
MSLYDLVVPVWPMEYHPTEHILEYLFLTIGKLASLDRVTIRFAWVTPDGSSHNVRVFRLFPTASSPFPRYIYVFQSTFGDLFKPWLWYTYIVSLWRFWAHPKLSLWVGIVYLVCIYFSWLEYHQVKFEYLFLLVFVSIWMGWWRTRWSFWWSYFCGRLLEVYPVWN